MSSPSAECDKLLKEYCESNGFNQSYKSCLSQNLKRFTKAKDCNDYKRRGRRRKNKNRVGWSKSSRKVRSNNIACSKKIDELCPRSIKGFKKTNCLRENLDNFEKEVGCRDYVLSKIKRNKGPKKINSDNKCHLISKKCEREFKDIRRCVVRYEKDIAATPHCRDFFGISMKPIMLQIAAAKYKHICEQKLRKHCVKGIPSYPACFEEKKEKFKNIPYCDLNMKYIMKSINVKQVRKQSHNICQNFIRNKCTVDGKYVNYHICQDQFQNEINNIKGCSTTFLIKTRPPSPYVKLSLQKVSPGKCSEKLISVCGKNLKTANSCFKKNVKKFTPNCDSKISEMLELRTKIDQDFHSRPIGSEIINPIYNLIKNKLNVSLRDLKTVNKMISLAVKHYRGFEKIYLANKVKLIGYEKLPKEFEFSEIYHNEMTGCKRQPNKYTPRKLSKEKSLKYCKCRAINYAAVFAKRNTLSKTNSVFKLKNSSSIAKINMTDNAARELINNACLCNIDTVKKDRFGLKCVGLF